ncbi:MAG: hypothetical protein ABS46_06880 [Cytophagaceae bacterium SCN 52-12]|nr:MAG: hypothetical protein ABS46_06880 [Cytophagaceae bacterium SCN 52-12]
MKRNSLQELAAKVSDGIATESELAEYTAWYRSRESSFEQWDEARLGPPGDRQARLLRVISQRIHRLRTLHFIRRWIPYAAAVVFVLVIAWVAIIPRQPAVERIGAADIQPGGTRATLTLSDGKAISLDEARSGIVISDQAITYNDGPLIVPWSEDGKKDLPGELLTLSTPRGGTYQVTLSDGTKVWLNAASSLKYPLHFDGNERHVDLVGEAFFSVTPSASTFRVSTAGQIIEVLGTRFNISAYPDEPLSRTTLVEGSVQVRIPGAKSAAGANRILSQGEQAVTGGSGIDVLQVDTESYTSWKDGFITLDHLDIASVVRQLERWYDVSFEVSGWPEGLRLTGELPRDTKLSGVLEALQLNTGKKLYIKERKVMEKRD